MERSIKVIERKDQAKGTTTLTLEVGGEPLSVLEAIGLLQYGISEVLGDFKAGIVKKSKK